MSDHYAIIYGKKKSYFSMLFFKHDKDKLKSFLKSTRSCFMLLSLVFCDSLEAIFKYFKECNKN